MKNFTRKFIGLLALVFTMSLTSNAQDCGPAIASMNEIYVQCMSDLNTSIINAAEINNELIGAEWYSNYYETEYNEAYSNLNSANQEISNLQNQITSLQSQLASSLTQADVDAAYASGASSVTPEDGITQADVDAAVAELAELMSEMNAVISEVNSSSSYGHINLPSGWSMFGYSCIDSIVADEGFASIADKIDIVKDEWGLSYLPSWEFNAMGSLHYSEGYQIKMEEEVTDFQFCKKNAPIEIGCSDPNAFNYSPNASITSSIVCVEKVFGCLDEDYLEFNAVANTNDELQCLNLGVFGCVNLFGTNYNAEANIDDGSCIFAIYGCMDENASNFSQSANTDGVVESNTYFNESNNEEDSNGDNTYFTDTFNDDELNVVVNSGGYHLWGLGLAILENSSVTINLNGDVPFNIQDFGSTQIENINNDGNQYQDCMMFGVDEYNEYYGEYEGTVSSCEDLFVFKPIATISASNGYSINISNENYSDYGDSWEFWGNLSQNLSGSASVTIETEENIKFKLINVSIQTVDESSSSCIPVLFGCIQDDQCNYNPLATNDDGSCYNNDVGCGCDVPLPEEGYNCQGNLIVGEIGDTINGGILFYLDETGQHGLIADFEDLGFLPWQTGVNACNSSTNAGYDDWYLPSINELELLINTLALNNNNIMNLDFNHEWAGYYWSSTLDGNRVFRSRIYSPTTSPYLSVTGSSYPEDSYFVRAIRAF